MKLLLLVLTTTLASSPVRSAIPPALPTIIVDESEPGIFPASWLGPPVNATARMLDEDQRQRSKDTVNAAFAKYPPAVLAASLRKVHVVGRLEYFGVATGGTNSRNAVYLANNGTYRSSAIEGVFHAELSSILLRNFPQYLDEKAWLQINPPDFKYLGNGVQAIKQKQASVRLDAVLNEQGFLAEYSRSNMENDFNTFADRLFMGDAGLWKVVDQYPKVRAKAELAIAFYGKLDPHFTKDFFISLRHPEKQSK